jgi:hypothetical protein
MNPYSGAMVPYADRGLTRIGTSSHLTPSLTSSKPSFHSGASHAIGSTSTSVAKPVVPQNVTYNITNIVIGSNNNGGKSGENPLAGLSSIEIGGKRCRLVGKSHVKSPGKSHGGSSTCKVHGGDHRESYEEMCERHDREAAEDRKELQALEEKWAREDAMYSSLRR